MNSIFTKDYQNKKIVPILKEYSAKKYGRRREFVDAETRARLGLGIDETSLPESPSEPEGTDEESSSVSTSSSDMIAETSSSEESPVEPVSESSPEITEDNNEEHTESE
jgi:hypothetical protein